MYNETNMSFPEVEKMAESNRFSKDLLDRAKNIAQEMLQSGEQIKPLKVGERQTALWVTAQKGQVSGSQLFRIEGITFYIGVKKKNN